MIVGESALGSALSLSESDSLGMDSKRLMSAATRPAVRMVGLYRANEGCSSSGSWRQLYNNWSSWKIDSKRLFSSE